MAVAVAVRAMLGVGATSGGKGGAGVGTGGVPEGVVGGPGPVEEEMTIARVHHGSHHG